MVVRWGKGEGEEVGSGQLGPALGRSGGRVRVGGRMFCTTRHEVRAWTGVLEGVRACVSANRPRPSSRRARAFAGDTVIHPLKVPPRWLEDTMGKQQRAQRLHPLRREAGIRAWHVLRSPKPRRYA